MIKNDDRLIKYKLCLHELCKQLCSQDDMFPPIGLWVEYYNVNSLEEIILIPNKTNRKNKVLL